MKLNEMCLFCERFLFILCSAGASGNLMKTDMNSRYQEQI